MSKRVSMFRPSYQLIDACEIIPGQRDWQFYHQGCRFTAKRTAFSGMTATQVAAMNWADNQRTPPVMSIRHEKPGQPDGRHLSAGDQHRHYHPYAMVIAWLTCLGERTSRRIKIYFCDVSYHEDNIYRRSHSKGKGTFIVPITGHLDWPEGHEDLERDREFQAALRR